MNVTRPLALTAAGLLAVTALAGCSSDSGTDAGTDASVEELNIRVNALEEQVRGLESIIGRVIIADPAASMQQLSDEVATLEQEFADAQAAAGEANDEVAAEVAALQKSLDDAKKAVTDAQAAAGADRDQLIIDAEARLADLEIAVEDAEGHDRRGRRIGSTVAGGERRVGPRVPVSVVVMGVTGSGKSTVGRALADRLGLSYVDADDLHSDASVAKMSAGHPLDDADRAPWLASVGRWLAARDGGVVACSALRRSYRDVIRDVAPRTVFLHLSADRELAFGRVSGRAGHFMPVSLVESQFAILEPLQADEAGLTIDADRCVDDISRRIPRLPATSPDSGPLSLHRKVRPARNLRYRRLPKRRFMNGERWIRYRCPACEACCTSSRPRSP